MDIKRILLPEQIDTDEELYYRRSEGVVVMDDGSLSCLAGDEVAFNTYFNNFSTGKWKKIYGTGAAGTCAGTAGEFLRVFKNTTGWSGDAWRPEC